LHSVPDLLKIHSFARGKVSNPRIRWFSFNKDSARLEPIKPATPVINQVSG